MRSAEPSQLLHSLLDMAEAMLNSGAEVNRVEDTLTRMGEAYGASRMNVFVITSSVVITILFPDGQELTQTRRITGGSPTDFTRLEQLNALSRECCTAPLPLQALQQRLESISVQNVSAAWPYLGSIFAAGGSAVFFGGNLWDGVIAAAFGVLICLLQRKLTPLCLNRVVFNLLGAIIAGLGISAVAALFPALHADKIMIGDIMLLIPGIAMTNSVRDILAGDTITGIMRLIESLLTAAVLAFGFMIAVKLMGG